MHEELTMINELENHIINQKPYCKVVWGCGWMYIILLGVIPNPL
jgi:hypothetical protein